MAKREGRSAARNIFFKNQEMNFTVLRALLATHANGAEIGECLRVVDETRDGDFVGFAQAWSAVGQSMADGAQLAAQKNDRALAREYYLRASNYFRSAMTALNPLDPAHKAYWEKARDNFELAGAYFDPPLQAVKVPYEQGHLPCYFLPADPSRKNPTLMVVTGGEGTNMETYFWAGAYALRRGYNVFLYEGPGNISTMYESGFTMIARAEIPIGRALDYLDTVECVDREKTALLGLSFGGYMVSRAAAFDKRVKAVIPDSPLRNISQMLSRVLPPLLFSMPDGLMNWLKDHFMEYSDRATIDNLLWEGGVSSLSEGVKVLKDYTLEGLEPQIECPTLALASEGEGAEFLQQAQTFYDRIASKVKRFRVFTAAEGAGAHCQVDNSLLMNQEVMSWLEEVFGICQ